MFIVANLNMTLKKPFYIHHLIHLKIINISYRLNVGLGEHTNGSAASKTVVVVVIELTMVVVKVVVVMVMVLGARGNEWGRP